MSVTFREATQVRSVLKMKLSNYHWYNGSCVLFAYDDYYISVHVKKLDNQVRKIIPSVYDGVSVKIDIE